MDNSEKRLILIDSLILITFYLLYILVGYRRIVWLVDFIPLYKYIISLSVVILAAYLLISVITKNDPDTFKVFIYKIFSISIIILILVLVPTIAFIIQRQRFEPYSFVHDGLLQTELAAKFVLGGKNPYSANFSDTTLAFWPIKIGDLTVNPALYHYIYLPFTFLFPIPFLLISEKLFGWFDLRLLYLFMYIGVLVIGFLLTTNRNKKILLLISLGFAPYFAFYIPDGRNDVFVLFWLFLSLIFLKYNNIFLSVIFFAIACTSKQFAWFFIPFYFIYLSGSGDWKERLRRIKIPLFLFISITFLITIFWIVWDPVAFYEDVIAYQSGLIETGYPVTGMGLSNLLLKIGVIQADANWMIFIYMEIACLILVTIFLIRRQLLKNTIKTAIFNYAILLAISLLFSRALNDNYLGYLFVILIIGSLIDTNSSYEKNQIANMESIMRSDQ